MLTFPSGLRPIAGGFINYAKTLGGGQSLSGIEQVASTMNDRWQASYRFPVRTDDDVLALRAFVMSMRGRASTVALPMFDLARAPWAVNAQGIKQTPGAVRTPSLDGTPFADAANLRDGLIRASITSLAALNAIQLSVAVAAGSAPRPGHFFSLGTRGYAVQSVTGAGPYTLEIWPWLRVAASSGQSVNFTSPVCEMRFATDSEGADALKSLDQLRFGSLTLNFDEASPA
jgi:hypothetical protein